ncbi:MAG: TMEM175 family protein [Novosphingobium sp.]
MTIDDPEDGLPGIGRVEAFSDGVLAIVITIMVLELKVPLEEGWHALWTLWPVAIAYVLSYSYVAIYWVNHHRLFSHARHVSGKLLWANNMLLFTLSLVPFATAYLGEHHFSRDAAQLYLAALLLPAFAYSWLQSVIRKSGVRNRQAEVYHDATVRKGYLAIIVYALGLGSAWISPWLAIACAALVAVFWILPWGPLDRLFLRCELPVD